MAGYILFPLLIGWVVCPSPVNAATLRGSFTAIPQGSVVDLTAAGPADWVHWGLYTESSLDRKAGVTPQIPDFTPIGFNGPYQYGDNFNGYSWDDGTPTAGVVNTPTGVWMYGKSNGFQFNVPADTTPRVLKLYVGTFGAIGELDATLASGSTRLRYTDNSISNVSNGPGGYYTLTYSADAPGQTLTINYEVDRTFDPAGNVTLQAAALTIPGANRLPTVSITHPEDGASFSTGDPIAIAADAADVDGSVAKVEFFAGGTKVGEAAASPFSLTWSDAPPGNYELRAVATDNAGGQTTSYSVGISVHGNGGTLSGSVSVPPPTVDLTADGTLDWAHWGLSSTSSFNHKAGVTPQIGNFTSLAGGSAEQYTDNYTAYSWRDGTPTAGANGTRTGVFTHGLANGFAFKVPADRSMRTLKVYVGSYGAQGNFQAYLSDFSAPTYSDTSVRNLYGSDYAVYTLNYAAASAGQTLFVTYNTEVLFDFDFGNITLQAASLSGGALPNNSPPVVALVGPADNQQFTAPANIRLEASASDGDGEVDVVAFFNGSTKIGEAIAPPYTITWSNVTAGAYTLTATATDNLGAEAGSGAVNILVLGEAPPTLTLLSPSIHANQVTFSFATQSGLTYTVESANSLHAPIQWSVLTNVTGNGSIATVGEAAATADRFYRVSTP